MTRAAIVERVQAELTAWVDDTTTDATVDDIDRLGGAIDDALEGCIDDLNHEDDHHSRPSRQTA